MHHQTDEGKKTHLRMLNFISKRPNGRRRVEETKLRNLRLGIDASNKIDEIADKLECTFSHVVERCVLEHGDTLSIQTKTGE